MLRSELTGGARAVRDLALACGLFTTILGMSPLAAQNGQKMQGQALTAGARPAVDNGAVRQLAADAIKQLDLQTELPRKAEPPRWRLNLPPETLWFVVVAGIAVLLYAFRDMIPVFRARGDGAWASEETGFAEAAAANPDVALDAADELAAQGRIVEAMHVLLLQALAEIRRRIDEQFADSMTSREILRSKYLSEELKKPLRDVISRVEWSYFGEHPAARDDYLACRESFGALARALHGRAAA